MASLSSERESSLLLVLPGTVGRLPVLQRLIDEFGAVTVLVQAEMAQRSEWARPHVSGWIEFGRSPEDEPSPAAMGGEQMRQLAWNAVRDWLDSRGAELKGCMTYDEWGIEICGHLSDPDRLGLPFTPLETVLRIRDKPLFRQLCAEAGLPAVRHCRVSRSSELEAALRDGPAWRYPVILKPAKGAGSYWVRKVDSEAELLAQMSALETMLHESDMPRDDADAGWICEEFFVGDEVDIDGWARDGELEWAMVSDNKPSVEGSCGETGGIYPSQLPPSSIAKLMALTRDVVAALPGLHSVFHFEALVNRESGEVMPIEMNMRAGGAECPICVEAVSGYYLPMVAAELALGREVRPPAPAKLAATASTNVHFEATGTLRACEPTDELHNDADYLCGVFSGAVGQRYVPNRGSQSCVAWLVAGGADALLAEENLQRCISKCNFEVEPDGEAEAAEVHDGGDVEPHGEGEVEGPSTCEVEAPASDSPCP